jgi:hypothetical protein
VLWRDYFDLPTIVNAMSPDDVAAMGDAPA